MMIERDAFAEVEVALMAHPAPADTLYFPFLATEFFRVAFRGKNSHAAMAPWEGVNSPGR